MNYIIIQGEESNYIEDASGLVAEMTFSNAGESAMIVDSTYVRDSHRGQSLGLLLLDSIVKRAQDENRKIVPLCPFVKAQFEKNQKYKEIAAQ